MLKGSHGTALSLYSPVWMQPVPRPSLWTRHHWDRKWSLWEGPWTLPCPPGPSETDLPPLCYILWVFFVHSNFRKNLLNPEQIRWEDSCGFMHMLLDLANSVLPALIEGHLVPCWHHPGQTGREKREGLRTSCKGKGWFVGKTHH